MILYASYKIITRPPILFRCMHHSFKGMKKSIFSKPSILLLSPVLVDLSLVPNALPELMGYDSENTSFTNLLNDFGISVKAGN